jgi:hypothetical protein
MILMIEGKEYEIEEDLKDPYVVSNLTVAYSDPLAQHFAPIIFDPRGQGDKPFPPDIIGYRLIIDPQSKKMCLLFEVYWRRQDCTWKELNKDHDHDYEQIQIHFNLLTGNKEKIVVSSVGPVENGGHGMEVFSYVDKAAVKTVVYSTSPEKQFPWGGPSGKTNATQIRTIPIESLLSEKGRPQIVILNCYHAFAGVKKELLPEEKKTLNPKLVRLDQELLLKWYYRHAENRFGHDISNPFKEPYVLYYPPPEELSSRIAYNFLWVFSYIKMRFGF